MAYTPTTEEYTRVLSPEYSALYADARHGDRRGSSADFMENGMSPPPHRPVALMNRHNIRAPPHTGGVQRPLAKKMYLPATVLSPTHASHTPISNAATPTGRAHTDSNESVSGPALPPRRCVLARCLCCCYAAVCVPGTVCVSAVLNMSSGMHRASFLFECMLAWVGSSA